VTSAAPVGGVRRIDLLTPDGAGCGTGERLTAVARHCESGGWAVFGVPVAGNHTRVSIDTDGVRGRSRGLDPRPGGLRRGEPYIADPAFAHACRLRRPERGVPLVIPASRLSRPVRSGKAVHHRLSAWYRQERSRPDAARSLRRRHHREHRATPFLPRRLRPWAVPDHLRRGHGHDHRPSRNDASPASTTSITG